MSDRDQHGVELEVDALFERNESILETHNISGAKVLHLHLDQLPAQRACGACRLFWGCGAGTDGHNGRSGR